MKAVALGAVILTALVLASAAVGRPAASATPLTKRPPIMVAGSTTAMWYGAIPARVARAALGGPGRPRLRAVRCLKRTTPTPIRKAVPLPRVAMCRVLVLEEAASAQARASRLSAQLARLNAELKALRNEIGQLRIQLAHAKR